MSQNPDQRRISPLKTGNSSLGNALADGSGTTGRPGAASGTAGMANAGLAAFSAS